MTEMTKRTLEDVLAAALRGIETGEPVSAQQVDGALDASPWLQLRDRLATSSRLDASTYGRNHGRQRMLAALAVPAVHRGGFRMIPTLFAMAPKAAMMAIGGLVLTGSAVGASAAVGGPNLPVAVLTAVGLRAEVQNSGGIGNAPDAAETGKDRSNGKALLGSGNAEAQVTGTVTAGINNAPDAAQNGKDHANERAFLGAANGTVNASVEATVNAGVGIGNAPDAAATGLDRAAVNAALGAGNAAEVAGTVTADLGIGNALKVPRIGLGHAAEAAVSGAANAEAHQR